MPTRKTAPAAAAAETDKSSSTPAEKPKPPAAAGKKAVPAAVQTAAQASAKAAAKAPGKSAAKPAEPVAAAAPKPKQRLVRDSFTIPKAEYAVIDELKRRTAKLEQPAKKSELLRAGIKALSGLPDAALLAALKAVPTLKTGRPKHK